MKGDVPGTKSPILADCFALRVIRASGIVTSVNAHSKTFVILPKVLTFKALETSIAYVTCDEREGVDYGKLDIEVDHG